MKIIIPMTGHGSRFVAEGYTRLKPFIKIHDIPMIQWVTSMFPGHEKDLVYILRSEHLKNKSYISKALKAASSKATIFKISDWKKNGPVSDVLKASDEINDSESVLVSYCDFFVNWNFNTFKRYIKKYNPDGVIPCYTGFHPHLAYKENLYATCEADSKNKLIKIREKFQINDNKFLDLQSPGLYYFKTGRILKEYCKKLIDSKESINGEYYMSLPYNQMVEDGMTVLCPPLIKHFCQWGTPRDLEEYNYWMDIVRDFKT